MAFDETRYVCGDREVVNTLGLDERSGRVSVNGKKLIVAVGISEIEQLKFHDVKGLTVMTHEEVLRFIEENATDWNQDAGVKTFKRKRMKDEEEV